MNLPCFLAFRLISPPPSGFGLRRNVMMVDRTSRVAVGWRRDNDDEDDGRFTPPRGRAGVRPPGRRPHLTRQRKRPKRGGRIYLTIADLTWADRTDGPKSRPAVTTGE